MEAEGGATMKRLLHISLPQSVCLIPESLRLNTAEVQEQGGNYYSVHR